MQLENTTKKCAKMSPSDIPVERGDLSEIARELDVSHAHVSRWYHGKNVHRAKYEEQMMKLLLQIHAKRVKAKQEIIQLKKEQGL